MNKIGIRSSKETPDMPLALSATVNQQPQQQISIPAVLSVPNTSNLVSNGISNGASHESGTSTEVVETKSGPKRMVKPPMKPRVWPKIDGEVSSNTANEGIKVNGTVNGHAQTNGHNSSASNGRPPLHPPARKQVNGVSAKLILRTNSSRSLDGSQSSNVSSRLQNNDRPKPVVARLRLPVSRGATPDSRRGSFSRDSSILTSRSPSPCSSLRSNSSLSSYTNTTTTQSESKRSLTPRRVFPQYYSNSESLDVHRLRSLEPSPVVFDANLSFVYGCTKQRIHQGFRASPAFSERETASNYLTDKISNFLNRTDHVAEEWKLMGKKNYDDDLLMSRIEKQSFKNRENNRTARSKSAANIMMKGFQLINKLPRTPRSRDSSVAVDDDDDDNRTICDVSEVGAHCGCYIIT